MSDITIQAGKDPKTGRFTAGNRWWEARSSHGPNPKFETADALYDACLQYFDWNEANPLWKDTLVTFQGNAKHEPVAQMRAMTIGGLCMFIGVSHQRWLDWRKERPDLLGIMTWAESVIYRQKFEGAAADLLNSNIIARSLGLTEKVENDHTSSDGSMKATIVIQALPDGVFFAPDEPTDD